MNNYVTHKSTKACKSSKQNKPAATSPVIPVANQNILEAAAKNTIFRDSFIPMDTTPADGVINESEETSSKSSGGPLNQGKYMVP